MPIDESELNPAINEAAALATELGLSFKLADPSRSRDRLVFLCRVFISGCRGKFPALPHGKSPGIRGRSGFWET